MGAVLVMLGLPCFFPLTMTVSHHWPKAVLFDLDDTLWPIGPVIEQAEHSLFAWFREHAPRLAAAHSIDSLRKARLELLARRPELGIDLARLREIALRDAFEEVGEELALVELAMEQFCAFRNAVTPYPDVAPGLVALNARTLVGSVTNGVADLAVIGLAGHFRVSVAAREFGRAKPDPGIFRAACELLAVAPHDALYVGDDLHIDVQGAQQAGLRAVWMNRAAKAPSGDAADIRPEAEVRSLAGLLAWLDGAPHPDLVMSRIAPNCL